MMDHSENTMRAAIKSLRDTVSPAVNPEDAQASEQLRLTIDFLEFLRTRIYDIHARHRHELVYQLRVAERLTDPADEVSAEAGRRLRSAQEAVRTVLADADAHTEGLREASQHVWGAVRGVVRESRKHPAELRERVSAVVLDCMTPLIELDSAWYAPFGFEPDPDVITPLDQLLRGAPATDRAS